MKSENIKPIPKYIREQIYKLDLVKCPRQENYSRFYSYLTKVKGELVKITVAVINYYKKWYCKQVFAHGVKSKQCLKKDIKWFSSMQGSGFKVGWYAEGCTKKHQQWFERGWQYSKFDVYYPYTETVNPEFVEKFKQYQYSAYKELDGDCIVAYLKLYEQYPQVEYLLKLGLARFRHRVSIVKRMSNNIKFRKWFIANRDELAKGRYSVPVINKAFKTGKTLQQAQRYIDSWRGLRSESYGFSALREMFKSELEQFCTYLQNQDSDPSSYIDYLNACNYLRLDMNRPDNRYPSDFQKWHDRRIEEYIAVKKRADEKERAEIYKQFAMVSEKYLALQKQGVYAVIIARSPADLIHEGEQLKHCVGKMNYEQKVMSEETLIFFVRATEQPDIPFVTVEYSLKAKKVLQCYGYQSKTPDDNVLMFVNKVWLPYANRTIKKLKEAA